MCKEYQEKHKGSNLKQCQKNFLWKCKLARNCIRRSMKFCWLKQRTFDRDVFSNMKCLVLVWWYIKILFLGTEKKFSDKMFYIQCHNRNILIDGINCVSFLRRTTKIISTSQIHIYSITSGKNNLPYYRDIKMSLRRRSFYTWDSLYLHHCITIVPFYWMGMYCVFIYIVYRENFP